MIIVTVLGFDYALASSLTGINDLLSFANFAVGDFRSLNTHAQFKVQIASVNKAPITTLNNVVITPHIAVEDINHSDVFLVPCIAGDINKTLHKNQPLVEFLRSLKTSQSIIGCNSTGSFFLAEAGLLDNKMATTHWSSEKLFGDKYPHVNLKTDQHITHDHNILCDGGGVAWFDLGLYIIELFSNHETAMHVAKTFVIDTGRSAQLSYSPLISRKYHHDKTVRKVQEWLDINFASDITIAEISLWIGLSNRTLIRRFNEATGITPLAYLQEVRLDAACKLLVQTTKTVDEITHKVGYNDISSFTKLFKRKIKLTPSSYRAMYQSRN